MRAILSLILAALVCLGGPAEARWKAEYSKASVEVQDWYANARIAPAAQHRFTFLGCCANSDVVKTHFQHNKTTKGDEWYWWKDNNWVRIPDDIIHWGESAPGGQATLFVTTSGLETCFWPPDSGN